MTRERNLRKLLRHMTPQLHPGTFVFSILPGKDVPVGLAPIATFREAAKLSAISALDEAQCAGVPYQFESGPITLTILLASRRGVPGRRFCSAGRGRHPVQCRGGFSP